MTDLEIVRELRKEFIDIGLFDCKKIAQKSGGDLSKAFWIASGCPEIDEDERLENLTSVNKIETEDHCVPVTCPHCNQDFFKLSEGACASAAPGE